MGSLPVLKPRQVVATQQADQADSPKRRGKTGPRRSQLVRGAL